MSRTQRPEPLRLPPALKAQLFDYRRRVWSIKMAEAAGVAVFSVVLAFLCVLALDRLWDTPRWLRLLLWMAALGGCGIVPCTLPDQSFTSYTAPGSWSAAGVCRRRGWNSPSQV